MRYDFHPEARLEYRESAVGYETRRPGLGAAFTLDIEAAIQKILKAPDRWRFVEQDVRRCLAHTFPYGIFYTIEDGFILIIAVAHGSREPGYWRHRLQRSAEPGAPGGGEAVFEVEHRVELRESQGLKVRELLRAEELATEHRNLIIQKWHEHINR